MVTRGVAATEVGSRAGRMRGLATAVMLMAGVGGVQAQASPQSVSGPEISVLIRSTILALHQANVTGNYSVMRDLGDRQFIAEHSQAGLADMFRAFRDNHVDLSAAVVLDADLNDAPRLTTDGYLRLSGHFPTTPARILFDMTFRYEDQSWRVDRINVGTSMQAVTANAANVRPPVVPIPKPRPAGR